MQTEKVIKNQKKGNGDNKLWSTLFIVFCLTSLIVTTVLFMLNNVMSLYVNHIGGNTALSGVLMLCFSVAAVISRLGSGYVADKKGRFVVILTGELIFFGSVILCAFLPYLGALPVLRLVQGIGYAAVNTATAAAVADIIPKNRFGEGIGYYTLAMSLAMALGPTFGLYLISGGNYFLMFILGGLLIFAVACLTVIFRRDDYFTSYQPQINVENTAANQYTGIWRYIEKKALGASLTEFLICFAMASIVVFATLFAISKGFESATAVFFIVSAVASILTRLFIGKLFDKYGPVPTLTTGFICGVFSTVAMIFVSNQIVFISIGAAYGFCIGITTTVLNTSALKNVDGNRRGAASATFWLSMDLGYGLGGAVWGIVIERFNFQVTFLGVTVVMLIGMVYSLFFFTNENRNLRKNDVQTTFDN